MPYIYFQFSDCECQTISISLKNDVLVNQVSRQGIYQKSEKINGRTTWISSNNKYRLWYYGKTWVITDVVDVGGYIGSVDKIGQNFYCPFDVPSNAWLYGSGGGEWILADSNDISVECLTGKKKTYFRCILL